MISDIWVDSDSVPSSLRTIILRLGVRIDVPVYFVADRELKDVQQFIAEDTHRIRILNNNPNLKSKIKMIVVETGSDSADNYIVEHVTESSFCVTHDIPLASRLLEIGSSVINDRGDTYSKDNIKSLLGNRAVNAELRSWGVFADNQKKTTTQASVKNFADNLDREIRKKQVVI